MNVGNHSSAPVTPGWLQTEVLCHGDAAGTAGPFSGGYLGTPGSRWDLGRAVGGEEVISCNPLEGKGTGPGCSLVLTELPRTAKCLYSPFPCA